MTCSKLSFLTKAKHIGAICLSIPVMTASGFSQIKTCLRSTLNDKSLSNLALESPVELTDSHLEEIVDLWNRKVEE